MACVRRRTRRSVLGKLVSAFWTYPGLVPLKGMDTSFLVSVEVIVVYYGPYVRRALRKYIFGYLSRRTLKKIKMGPFGFLG